MQNIIKPIQTLLQSCMGDHTDLRLEVSKKNTGWLQTSLALSYKHNKDEQAKQIASIWKKQDIIADCFVSDGYINIDVSSSFLRSRFLHLDTCFREKEKGKKAIVDFGGMNVGKPLHTGHLRTLFVGDALVRIYRYCGWEVLSDIHLGDWGLPCGIILSRGYKPGDDINTMLSMYVEGKNAEDLSGAKKSLFRIQNRQDPEYSLWKDLKQRSLAYFKSKLQELDISFDLYLGESDARASLATLLQEHAHSLVGDQGSLSWKNKIVLKTSSDTFLYIATDWGTLYDRVAHLPTKVIYVIDNRQKGHIDALKTLAKESAICDPQIIDFVGIGTLNDKANRPIKTRSGEAIDIDAFLATIRDSYAVVEQDRDINPEDRERLLLSCLKYSILMFCIGRSCIYDQDRLLSYEGNTGAYLLYTCKRLQVLLERVKDNSWLFKDSLPYDQKALLLCVSRLEDEIWRAAQKNDPSILCSYSFDLCKKINALYGSYKLIDADNRVCRDLYLLFSKSLQALTIIIDLLGMTIPRGKM